MIFNEGHAVAEGELPPRHQLTAHCLLGQADVLHIKKDHKGGWCNGWVKMFFP
jgi:hypothetical protein